MYEIMKNMWFLWQSMFILRVLDITPSQRVKNYQVFEGSCCLLVDLSDRIRVSWILYEYTSFA
jgi:hypothetical protein